MSRVFRPGARIWVISPQRWHDLNVSKHHYAREVAALGCRVCFIEPPGRVRGVRILDSGVAGIEVVQYGTWFPYQLKFHAPRLFDIAMQRQARILTKKLAGPADLIWDFDNAGQFSDLRNFGAKQTLFHLVDAPSRSSVGTKHADFLATLHPAFMEKSGSPADVPIVDHGLAQVHADMARKRLHDARYGLGSEIALVGNLSAAWIDWPVIAEMVARFPERTFRLIGPTPLNAPTAALRSLHSATNCIFTGRLTAKQIANLGDQVAVWLIAFDDQVQGGPTDTHKMREYLATGAPVLTSWLANWAGSDQVTMATKGDNSAMPDLLAGLLDRPQTAAMCRRRIETALAGTYATRLSEIEALLADPPR